MAIKWDKPEQIKAWARQKAARAKMKAGDVVRWIKEHPVEAAALGTAAVTVANKGAKIYGIHSEMKRRDTDFYDPRTGTHAFTRRRLKAREQAEIDRRYNQGESYVSIFNDMNLLK